MSKTEAHRLADELEEAAGEYWRFHKSTGYGAAAELRRLASVEAQRDALRAELKEATEAINDPAVNNLRTLPESIRVLCAQRDALLEALKGLMQQYKDQPECFMDWSKARAAIKAVRETK